MTYIKLHQISHFLHACGIYEACWILENSPSLSLILSYCIYFVSLLAYPVAAVIISLVHYKLNSFYSVIGDMGCDAIVFLDSIIKGTHIFHDFHEVRPIFCCDIV